jgi:hypothetical protein
MCRDFIPDCSYGLEGARREPVDNTEADQFDIDFHIEMTGAAH